VQRFIIGLLSHAVGRRYQNVLSALEIFLSMRYINLHFTYLLPYQGIICFLVVRPSVRLSVTVFRNIVVCVEAVLVTKLLALLGLSLFCK